MTNWRGILLDPDLAMKYQEAQGQSGYLSLGGTEATRIHEGGERETGCKGLDHCVTLRDTVGGVGLFIQEKERTRHKFKHKNRGCVCLLTAGSQCLTLEAGIKNLMDK